MRNKILLLVPIMLLVLAMVGCIPGIIPSPEPEPESAMEAVALAELSKDDADKDVILWSIVNTGDVFIREYTLTFEVYYPMKDYVIVTREGEYLEVGDMHSGNITLVEYDTPESVSVTWELFE